MKRIFLLSAMIIASFGIMNLATAQTASSDVISPVVGANAKVLVTKINQVVSLHGNQFGKVNDACIEYCKKLDVLNHTKPADYDAQVAALKQTRDAKIKASLDPSQVKSFASFKE